MPHFKLILKRSIVVIGLAAVLVCPLTFAAGVSSVSSQPIAQPIVHTPDIDPLEIESEPEEILENDLELPEIFVEGNILVYDGKPYPIGDAFIDGKAIPTGPEITDRTGQYGYAAIEGLPGHVLLWYLDGSGKKQYLITTDDDPRLTGPLGFDAMVNNLKEAQDRFFAAVGGGAGIALTAIGIQVAACGGTVGATCVTAVVTAVVAAGAATITSVALIIFDLIPAFNNVARAFRGVDASAPPMTP